MNLDIMCFLDLELDVGVDRILLLLCVKLDLLRKMR